MKKTSFFASLTMLVLAAFAPIVDFVSTSCIGPLYDFESPEE
ncbi:hypothetical protein [Paenibacillus guangzhouensis]|nr:hypothetical protein [Paenibacillus guangzhouensis]